MDLGGECKQTKKEIGKHEGRGCVALHTGMDVSKQTVEG